MISDPGNLADLQDIVVPPQISYWPPAPGVWILVASGVALFAVAIVQMMFWRRANAYRRAALVELASIAASVGRTLTPPQAAMAIFALVKRTALVAFPRPAVASLSGTRWSDFLARTCEVDFDQALADRLSRNAYDAAAWDSRDVEALAVQAQLWIRHHHVGGGRGSS